MRSSLLAVALGGPGMRWAPLLCATAMLVPCLAHADQSSQGPYYVQGGVGVSYWDFPHLSFFGFSTSWAGFWPNVEAGLHVTGRHDGLVLAVRQSFIITAVKLLGPHAGGTTALRAGYDIPFKVGSLELNVDPYAMLGVGYIFDGPSAGIQLTAGADVKLFFARGVYAFARPVELGMQCFEDSGNCAFAYAAAAGAGFAFGQ